MLAILPVESSGWRLEEHRGLGEFHNLRLKYDGALCWKSSILHSFRYRTHTIPL